MNDDNEDDIEVIDRLRTSQRRHERVSREEGIAPGRRWARNRAEVDELERLAGLREDVEARRDDWEDYFREDPGGQAAYGPAEAMAFEILDVEQDRDLADAFWRTAVGRDRDPRLGNAAFLLGFADGA